MTLSTLWTAVLQASLHYLLELDQTHVHWVGDAIQPFHPLSSPSPTAFDLSQHQGFFPWVGSSFRWPKYWSFSFNISPSGDRHSFPWVLVHTGFCLCPKSISQRRQWKPTPVLLPGNSHGQRSLVGCSPWGHKESDTTERLHFHFSPSCIGKGNGNPLQYSCLENPRDRGAWWAAVYGVSQSRTWLKRLSSSSSSSSKRIAGEYEG